MKFNNTNILYLKGEEYNIDFNRSTLYVSHMFLRLLGKYEVGTHCILMINLVPPSLKELNGVPLRRNEFVEQLQVLQYYRDFDIDVFQDYSLAEKSLCLWNIIVEVMRKAAMQYGWDQVQLEATYEQGIAANLKNEFYFKDYKTSPDRKLKAIVRVDFEMDICLVYADFHTRDGAFIRSDLFFDWDPSTAFYNLFALKNASWNKDQFILHLKDGGAYNVMMPIGDVIWSFKDEYGDVAIKNEQLFPWALLLERLMKETYAGTRIRAIRLNFVSKERYLREPELLPGHAHAHIGKLSYNDVFDFDAFDKMSRLDRPVFMWNKAHEILKVLATETDNGPLLAAADYAWRKGLAMELTPDYRLLEATVALHGEILLAAIWMQFSADRMTAVFKLEKEGKVLLEKSISSTILGIGFLLEAFKSIEATGDTIIIKGSKSMRELPMVIPVEAEIILLQGY